MSKIQEEIKQARCYLEDSITLWYIVGCKYIQDPRLTLKEKKQLKDCIETLSRMIE